MILFLLFKEDRWGCFETLSILLLVSARKLFSVFVQNPLDLDENIFHVDGRRYESTVDTALHRYLPKIISNPSRISNDSPT